MAEPSMRDYLEQREKTLEAMDQRSCTCHPDDNPPRPCPRKFALSECRSAASEGFASQVWGLSLFAQAELDNGDVDGAKKTLVRIAEVASEHASNNES